MKVYRKGIIMSRWEIGILCNVMSPTSETSISLDIFFVRSPSGVRGSGKSTRRSDLLKSWKPLIFFNKQEVLISYLFNCMSVSDIKRLYVNGKKSIIPSINFKRGNKSIISKSNQTEWNLRVANGFCNFPRDQEWEKKEKLRNIFQSDLGISLWSIMD